ncbi:MAG: hypothetical protein AAFV95_22820 [Bacteroidota bacterium]
MQRIARIWDRIYDGHRICALVGALSVLMAIAFYLLGEWDDRVLQGVNIWLKPTKFAISLVIFIWTIALLLPLYPYSDRKKRWMGSAIAWILLAEVVIIAVQAWRGELSHFNQSTQLNRSLFMLMGTGVAIVSVFLAWMGTDTFRKPMNASPVVVRSLQFALVAAVMACFGGGMMGSQLQHSVGVADGGEGLPIVNWSLQGGDLRVMHFFGLHALQILPLTALVLDRRKAGQSWLTSLQWMNIIGLLYVSFVVYTFVEALLGHPFLRILLLP